MFCPKCGEPLASDDEFCSNCGVAVKRAAVGKKRAAPAILGAASSPSPSRRRRTLVWLIPLCLALIAGGVLAYVFFWPRVSPQASLDHQQKAEAIWQQSLNQNSLPKGELLQQSIAELENALQSNPENLTARQQLANSYIRANQWEEAQQAYAEMVRRTPDDPFAQAMLELLSEEEATSP